MGSWLSYAEFLTRVTFKQTAIEAGLKLVIIDDDTPGAKHSSVSWGQCAPEYASHGDGTVDGMTCPFDVGHDKPFRGLTGCYWRCQLHRPKLRSGLSHSQLFDRWLQGYTQRRLTVSASSNALREVQAVRLELMARIRAALVEFELPAFTCEHSIWGSTARYAGCKVAVSGDGVLITVTPAAEHGPTTGSFEQVVELAAGYNRAARDRAVAFRLQREQAKAAKLAARPQPPPECVRANGGWK